jgi:hypothetical protein
MPSHLLARAWCALLALGLFALLAPPPLIAAEAKIKCASCGKEVSKAIKVIHNGRVYYVCSKACADKIKKK